MQDARLDKLKGNEEPPGASVTVEERVDGLELGV